MKKFYPTYLYVKTHNITGLKYFGKTTKDPLKYNGSGKYWLSHLKKHGYGHDTEIIGYYEDKDECNRCALNFSKKNNIVESMTWANIVVENGLDGGATIREYHPMLEETKEKISKSLKGKPISEEQKCKISNALKGRKRQPMSEDTKEKLRNANLGKKRSKESIDKTANALRGRKRPEASKWLFGREVSSETKKKISESNKGKIVTEATKEKIRKARANQSITEETKEKLKGKIVVVDKQGKISKIDKETYYSQGNSGDNRAYVFHNSKEGKRRKILK